MMPLIFVCMYGLFILKQKIKTRTSQIQFYISLTKYW